MRCVLEGGRGHSDNMMHMGKLRKVGGLCDQSLWGMVNMDHRLWGVL